MSLQTASSTSVGAFIHVNILVPLELYAPVCSYLIENAALSRAPIYADQKGIQAAAIAGQQPVRTQQAARLKQRRTQGKRDRKSVVKGQRVSVRVDIGVRRIIKKKTTQNRQVKTR